VCATGAVHSDIFRSIRYLPNPVPSRNQNGRGLCLQSAVAAAFTNSPNPRAKSSLSAFARSSCSAPDGSTPYWRPATKDTFEHLFFRMTRSASANFPSEAYIHESSRGPGWIVLTSPSGQRVNRAHSREQSGEFTIFHICCDKWSTHPHRGQQPR